MWSIIQAAGWPIWPLIFASIVALALILERLWSLRQTVVAPPGTVDKVLAEYKQSGAVAPELLARTAQRGPRRYRVQKGDTLAALADRYGVPVEALAEMNRMRTSAHLKPGRTIKSTPTNPAATASQRAGPARSPKNSTPSAITISGEVAATAWVSASGR